MRFPDETFAQGVQVVPFRGSWAVEVRELKARSHTLLPEADSVDHIGSTPVPGLPGKDCIDAMIRVRDRHEQGVIR